MGILTEAAGLAQETIGKGLVDALVLAGGKDGNIQDVADSMQNLANFTSDAIRGVGVLASKLTDLDAKSGGVGQFLKDLTYYNPVRILARLGEETRPRPRANRNFGGSSIQGNLYDADAAKQKKLEADRLKVVKAQEASNAFASVA
jgi:hypothetical protein